MAGMLHEWWKRNGGKARPDRVDGSGGVVLNLKFLKGKHLFQLAGLEPALNGR
ncbi:MAG: hypothetical protein ACOCW9_02260 [Thermodesulfobacteriota bacterium]